MSNDCKCVSLCCRGIFSGVSERVGGWCGVGIDRECTELGQMETAPFSCSARQQREKRLYVFIFRALSYIFGERASKSRLTKNNVATLCGCIYATLITSSKGLNYRFGNYGLTVLFYARNGSLFCTLREKLHKFSTTM
jgi:hypothetical protein